VAPPEPPTCGFGLVSASLGGAGGSALLGVTLKSAVASQRCSAQVTVSAAITTANGSLAGGVRSNPATVSATVSFVPSQLPPLIRFQWDAYCTTVAEPVDLAVRAAGQSAVTSLGSSISCEARGTSSFLIGSSSPTSQVSVVGLAPNLAGNGYRLADQDGYVTDEGNAPFLVAEPDTTAPIVAIVGAPSGDGDWLASSSGGVFSYGSAAFHGSAGGTRLNSPIVGMAADPATGGYWLVGSDGGVFSYGAPFYRSAGGRRLNAPVVGMASTPDGGGYWLVAADGGVFSYGDARFSGSAGSVRLNSPIVGMAASRSGGYWLVAAAGGVFSYGTAFHGSASSVRLNAPVAGMASTPDGGGYWLVGADGGVFTYGDAHFYGSAAGTYGHD